ncbi:Six-hairpin glycosidase-like protein [Xylariaceae sp. FL0016]|nr:Six-hairpin glycosidase-like protein [Xylariaceae sp. FL0016]
MNMKQASSWTLLLMCQSLVGALSTSRPHSFNKRSTQARELILSPDGGTVSMTSNGSEPDIVVIDYGHNIEGIPTFEVASHSGGTSVLEITYSETQAGLDLYMSDGPLALAAAMDSYRVNAYNIKEPTTFTNRLIQGGFRYQKLNLSTAGSLEIRNLGVSPTTNTTPLTQLPGSFSCSDEELTRIWHAGARTVQLSEIPQNTIPLFWELTSEGALVESLVPQVLQTIEAAQLLQYQINFEVKPITRGFGFMVLGSTLNVGIYIYCDIANKVISAHYGSTERDSEPLATASLPTNITLGSWHSVEATAAVTDVTVSIDGLELLSFTQTSSFYGSAGLGASYGHAAIFRNFNLNSSDGSYSYSASFLDDTFWDDFLMGQNPNNTVVDGSRRDRIAYTGDLDIALGSAFASTDGGPFVEGAIDLLGSFQATPGFFIPTAKIQQPPRAGPLDINTTGLIGYSFNFLTAIAQYYEMTGDSSFADKWATPVIDMLEWANSQVLSNGLLNISDASIGGDWNYYDPTQSGVVTKFNMVYAYSLQECISFLQASAVDTTSYEERLSALRNAIDTQLWSDDLNAYILSEAVTDGFAQDANALAILAGVASANHSAETILGSMASELYLPAGPLAFSPSTTEAGFAQKISPYSSAYHLRAAFMVNDTETVKTLLTSLWAPMANPQSTNYTNCFWETLLPDGTPGLGITTSMCHAWASGPTAELSRNVLGIQATAPGFQTWKIVPQTLGLEWAKGKHPTPHGAIQVDWKFVDGLLKMTIEGPVGTQGTVHLPSPMMTGTQESVIKVNGQVVNGTSFTVQGGRNFTLIQERSSCKQSHLKRLV